MLVTSRAWMNYIHYFTRGFAFKVQLTLRSSFHMGFQHSTIELSPVDGFVLYKYRSFTKITTGVKNGQRPGYFHKYDQSFENEGLKMQLRTGKIQY